MPCVQAASEVLHMQAALTQATEDSYHKLDPAEQGRELHELQDHWTQRPLGLC